MFVAPIKKLLDFAHKILTEQRSIKNPRLCNSNPVAQVMKYSALEKWFCDSVLVLV